MTSFDWPKCFDFQGDTCQHPIGLPMSLFTRVGLLMSFLHAPMCYWFLHVFYVPISTTLGKILLVSE